ncbi:hypothetical protein K488DRAFT_74047 [Vararia minispora EC-137]|uniref:Uncharacterized protein n=1 Tax=Vararia minispora EC-137 TaxID=1314806 RepID=A0ACB8Q8R1_9AGAM|nr:hypothetical protein K488DRAFT_74047 [Vararia minispora EC-137]
MQTQSAEVLKLAGRSATPDGTTDPCGVSFAGELPVSTQVGTQVSKKRKRNGGRTVGANNDQGNCRTIMDSITKDETPQKSGWIWTVRPVKNMSDEDMKKWEEEGDRVQWFRAEAEMLRWREQYERVLADLHRTIETFVKMSKIWFMLRSEGGSPGHAAYANKKGAMFTQLAERATQKLRHAGYEPLGDDESLIERLQQWRTEEGRLCDERIPSN